MGLEAIIDRKLVQCRELERALGDVREAAAALGLDGPVPEPGQAPDGARRSPRRAVGNRSGNPSREELLACVKAHGRMTRRQVQAVLGGELDAIGKTLGRMARAGLLIAEGSGRSRTYRLAGLEPVAAPEDGPLRCTDADEMLALIRRGATSSERIHELTGASYLAINELGNELMCRRLVVPSGEGKTRVWRMAPPEDLPAAVLATIAARPGLLDERGVALSLRAPHDRVALACAELIDHGKVALTERGTYLPLPHEPSSLELAA